MKHDMKTGASPWRDPPPNLKFAIVDPVVRARNWGLVCGFGYGFAAATFAFLILLFVTAPHT